MRTEMRPRLLLVGSTGLLGQALSREASARGYDVIGSARHNADIYLDIRDRNEVVRVVAEAKPTLVINSAAVTNLEQCEREPGEAYLVNSRAACLLGESSKMLDAKFVHISTDHFYVGDGRRKHTEDEPVKIINDYARSKFAGEKFAMNYPAALVVRTNVTGYRGWEGKPTFGEWLVRSILQREPLKLFDDYFCSTMDTESCSRIIFDMLERDMCGLWNIASSEVSSKKEFAEALANALGVELDWAEASSVKSLPGIRADSLGLDVSKAEAALGYGFPDLKSVARNLVEQFPESFLQAANV